MTNASLKAVKSDDTVRVCGVVREIQLRTIVVVVPGVVLGPGGMSANASPDGSGQTGVVGS